MEHQPGAVENMVNYFWRLQETFRGKRVFLTGHTGFKGAWLLQTLKLLSAEVKGYALAPEQQEDLYNLIDGNRLCQSVIDDLRNRNRLISEIVQFQPDFVFHLAAQPLVRLSYDIPAETFEVNAIGTANLLDGVRALEKPCSVVLVTTDKVYHNHEWYYPYRENDRLGGYDPYSASKACAELIIDSYRNSFFNPKDINAHQKGIAVARAGNVIGGGDWAKDRLLPDIVRALGNNQSITVRNPAAVRPWQHVLEPVLAYLILAKHLSEDAVKYSQAYNFGPAAGDTLSVEQMVNISISSWGAGSYETVAPSQVSVHEAGLLKLDISKAQDELKWRPRMDARKAVQKTIDWYKEFYNKRSDISEYTLQEISSFLNDV